MELEARVSRVERDSAVLEQRTLGLSQQIGNLGPLATQMVRLEGSVSSMREGLTDIRREISGIREGMDDRSKEQSDERRALKLALIGLTGVILAALIGGVFILLASNK